MELVKELLWPKEKVDLCIRQCGLWPLGGSWSSPIVLIATNMRLIVVSKMLFGIRHDYEIIHYNQIIGMRVIRGILTSTICIKTNGLQTHPHEKPDKNNGLIPGIYKSEEEKLSSYLNNVIEKVHERDRDSFPETAPVETEFEGRRAILALAELAFLDRHPDL
ncbi:MAG: PH domain-containing protein [Candidatus Micrarchaeota archaeon]|nr:PH domain-containing protein [Candidatus Micrarchaeota archaeon]